MGVLFVDKGLCCALGAALIDPTADAETCIRAVLEARDDLDAEPVVTPRLASSESHRFTRDLLAEDTYDACITRGVLKTVASPAHLLQLKDNQVPVLFRGPLLLRAALDRTATVQVAQWGGRIGLLLDAPTGSDSTSFWRGGWMVAPVHGFLQSWWRDPITGEFSRYSDFTRLLRILAYGDPLLFDVMGVAVPMSGAMLEVVPIALWEPSNRRMRR